MEPYFSVNRFEMTSIKSRIVKKVTGFSALVSTAYIFNVSLLPDFLTVVDFSTEDEAFQYIIIPQKGRDVKMMELNFFDFKERNGTLNDSVRLFRITKRDWRRVGNWHSYLTDEHWQYEYMEL